MSYFGKYVLQGKTPVPCDDLLQWGRWMQQEPRHVALDHVGDCMVSTIFLGLDHNFGDEGPPLLFETMAFAPEASALRDDGTSYTYRPTICSMERYATWDEAAAGHKRILAEVQAYLLETATQADEAIIAIARKR